MDMEGPFGSPVYSSGGTTAPLAIDVIVPRNGARRWQAVLIDRLRQNGHDVAVLATGSNGSWPLSAEAILWFEAHLPWSRDELAAKVGGIAEDLTKRAATLRIDLSGAAAAPTPPIPTLRLTFDGCISPAAAVATLSSGGLPNLEVVLDGRHAVGRAAPMVDNRVLIGRGLDDVLARAITLTLSSVAGFGSGRPTKTGPAATARPVGPLLIPYLFSGLPRLASETVRRVRYHAAHWRVGYRFIDGPGVPATNRLGDGWQTLPDCGNRFFADPFPFEHEGRCHVFVEDFDHASRKACISVFEFGTDGSPTAPRKVLEEGHHLSYPQVFSRGGAIWMIPESSAASEVTLYRAESFPERWVRHATLIADRQLSDATFLEHAGSLYLFATERDGYGSTSDTLVVFHADGLEGPWVPHPQNPIMIDRAAARPGGSFVQEGSRILLPLQDGTRGYGGGLGFAEVLRLDRQEVHLTPPAAVLATEDRYSGVHTFNRAGRLEVIDRIATVSKSARLTSL